MADPLSIAASIAGIISIADLVYLRLKKIVKYARNVKHAADDIEALAAEVGLMSGTLHRLSLLARALDDEPVDPTLRMEHIQGCRRVLGKIERLANKALGDLEGTSKLDALQRKLKWPFSSSDINDLMSELSLHKDSITLALSADTMNGLLRNLAMTADIRGSVNEIVAELGDMRKITTRIQEDSERRKILDFFGRINPQQYYDSSLSLRHPLTGLWLLELPELKDWLAEPGSSLWLRGIPGAGKTVLAGNIIEKALRRSSEDSAVAFFFCDYRDGETLEALNILGALASQLARQSDAAYDLLERHYLELHPRTGLPKKPTVDGLKLLLAELAAVYGRAYVVVDGLDECGKQLRDVVRALLPDAESKKVMSVAILSRDEDEIRRATGDQFVPLEISAHSEDLSHYVSAQIAERLQSGRLRFHDPALTSEIAQALIDGAGGMFRWVACQLDHLEECYSDAECRQALTRLPPGLPETYARILHRVGRAHAPRVDMALNFIAYSSPRLDLEQLMEVLSIPETGPFKPSDTIHEEAISVPCSSLIRKSPSGSEFVFAHKSVQDFLENQEHLEELGLGHFNISKPRCSLLLAKQLLRYLLLPAFGAPLPLTADKQNALLEETNRRYKLLYYAVFSWPAYARGFWDDPQLQRLGLKLFDRPKTTNFIHWTFGYLRIVFGREQMSTVLPVLMHRDFRPLHMAAVLALEGLCEPLLKHTQVNLKSPIGTPIQCAISGPRSFGIPPARGKALGREISYPLLYAPRLDLEGDCQIPCVFDTVQHLAARGLDLASTPVRPLAESIVSSAFATARLVRDLRIVCEVLDAGAQAREDEMHAYQASLDSLDDYAQSNRWVIEQDLERLVQILNQHIEESPAYLQLCSMVWNKALKWRLPFSFDPMNVSSRVSMTEAALQQLAFSAVRSADMDLLQRILKDSRANLPEISDSSKASLLHAAMQRFDGADTDQRHAIFCKLVQAGCDLGAVDGQGLTPLHVWGWTEPSQPDIGSLDEVVGAFVTAKFGLQSASTSGDNVLHSQVRSKDVFLGGLKAILAGFPAEDVNQALFGANVDGHTPLTIALERDTEDIALLLLSYCRPAGHSPADWQKLAHAAAGSGSASVVQRLLELNAEALHDEDAHPLHHIKASLTIRCLRLLKPLAPLDLEKRVGGRLPVEVYLRECLAAQTAPNTEIVKELEASSIPEKALVWKFYADAVARKPNFADFSQELYAAACSAATCLVSLGYSAAFEADSSLSSLKPLLCPFGEKPIDLWLLESTSGLFPLLVAQTQHWASVVADPIMSFRLLIGAFEYGHLDFLRQLLEKGLSLQAREGRLTALEQMCLGNVHPDHEVERLLEVVFSHLGDYPINSLNPISRLTLLHTSRESDSPWLVEKLIAQGANPNMRSSLEHDTPLLFHLARGAVRTARALLRGGADPTLRGEGECDAILVASLVGLPVILEDIKSLGNPAWNLDWNSRGKVKHGNFSIDEGNGYHLACARGHLAILELFESHNLIPNPVHTVTGRGGFTPLHVAAQGNQVHIIQHLAAKGADLDVRAGNMDTPLHSAIRLQNLEAVRALLDLGASPGRLFGFGEPMTLARQTDNQAIMARLRHAIDSEPTSTNHLDPRSLARALEGAVQKGDLESCKALLAKGCPVDTDLPSCGGCSPLLEAIRARQPAITRWLLHSGASTIKRACHAHRGDSALVATVSMRSPKDPGLSRVIAVRFWEEGGEIFNTRLLNRAIASGDETTLRGLLEAMELCREKQMRSQENSARDSRDIWTMMESSPEFDEGELPPLVFATRFDLLPAVGLLLEHGAGRYASQDGQLQECLQSIYASSKAFMAGQRERLVSKILSLGGPGLDSCGPSTENALITACSHRANIVPGEDAIDFLLSHGVDPSMMDIQGHTALHLAARKNRLATFAKLVRAGADPHRATHFGVSAIHLAMHSARFAPLLLNGDFAIETCAPIPWHILHSTELQMYGMVLRHKLYRRRIPGRGGLKRILNLEPDKGWSPLCYVCTLTVDAESTRLLGGLLDLGADPDHDGSPHGPALMAACATNRVAFARLLVRRGAALVARRRDGASVSAVAAARRYPDLVGWLLCGRFTDQAKMCAPPPSPPAEGSSSREPSGSPPAGGAWGGPVKAGFVITGEDERQPHESILDYLVKLQLLKRWARGKVVVVAGSNHKGARTFRPSRMVPFEPVRRHPDDRRSPRNGEEPAAQGSAVVEAGVAHARVGRASEPPAGEALVRRRTGQMFEDGKASS